VHHYGARPEFVVLGGLVPELLCSTSRHRHAGTTDIDVQVDLEIACGSVNMAHLERALLNAEFLPTEDRAWRWISDDPALRRVIVKFELLADMSDQAAGDTIKFDGCQKLGAANLRGTGFAARDFETKILRNRHGGIYHDVEINITGLAGFLLAKAAAAQSRRKPKDWYDIAFVLLHNDLGGVQAAANRVRAIFHRDLDAIKNTLIDLAANFQQGCQGPDAYAQQMTLDHPELDATQLRADAILAVSEFHAALYGAH
jgi:hypothetical protein